ncbi:hypothetical protein J7U46_11035 [Pelomonas sp. V22]|uniref:hypothetical protein n=1 Tax=Pelomonas sp. V22 TaxID=2822139 RepID=UPI0024A8089D|nr:hypothetical protein [Pelomonas sp. V22]MDI4633583.1 hypothetical protein [Pelomonas sp. V22]
MWKLLVGFVVFAALALFILSRGGDIDMGGEKHDVAAGHAEPAASAASAAASAPEAAASAAASAASN